MNYNFMCDIYDKCIERITDDAFCCFMAYMDAEHPDYLVIKESNCDFNIKFIFYDGILWAFTINVLD